MCLVDGNIKKKWCTFLIYAFIVALPAKVWQLF